jgi:tRNA pseudouridine38-40 synthase
MRHIRLLIQYDGTAYGGWQVQPNAATIQGLIEQSLKKITGEEINVIAAGRTDAGVHALAQVACFRTSSRLAPDIFQKALNALLPCDIRITETAESDDTFHARFSARGKSYFYLISTDRIVSPFLHRYVWRLPYELDFNAMKEAMFYFRGTHDFSAFRGSGCSAKTTVRTIAEATAQNLAALEFITASIEGNFIKFRFEGNAFLRHMVRNMVGTIVEAGKGKIKPEDIERIMNSCDRRCAGPTAPAQGLFLERIEY